MTPLLLHLGCGPIMLHGFVNIDHSAHWNPDLCIDYLLLSNHYEENSVDVIFCCHSIEHLDYPKDAVRFFVQARRALKPGGVLRIVVPDLKKVATKYVNGSDLRDVYNMDAFYYRDCPAERFMYFCREWQHEILFDEELLSSFMRDAGFVNIRRCAFGDSDTFALRHVDRYPSESLSMECTKP